MCWLIIIKDNEDARAWGIPDKVVAALDKSGRLRCFDDSNIEDLATTRSRLVVLNYAQTPHPRLDRDLRDSLTESLASALGSRAPRIWVHFGGARSVELRAASIAESWYEAKDDNSYDKYLDLRDRFPDAIPLPYSLRTSSTAWDKALQQLADRVKTSLILPAEKLNLQNEERALKVAWEAALTHYDKVRLEQACQNYGVRGLAKDLWPVFLCFDTFSYVMGRKDTAASMACEKLIRATVPQLLLDQGLEKKIEHAVKQAKDEESRALLQQASTLLSKLQGTEDETEVLAAVSTRFTTIYRDLAILTEQRAGDDR